MDKLKALQKGCVVLMKQSSGLQGWGNPQCVSYVCEGLGEISLYGHNQHYKTYDVDKVLEYPQHTRAQPEAVTNAGDARDYLIRNVLKPLWPNIMPLNDLMGVCTQVDNVATELQNRREIELIRQKELATAEADLAKARSVIAELVRTGTACREILKNVREVLPSARGGVGKWVSKAGSA